MNSLATAILLCTTTTLLTASTLVAQGSRSVPRDARGARPAVRTIDHRATAASLQRTRHCRAYAPSDWRIVSGGQNGESVDFVSADGRIYAGWGIRGVNRGMEQVYGPLFGDPERSSLATVGAVLRNIGGGGAPRYTTAPQRIGSGFVARDFASATHRGLVVYRVYPAPPGSPGGSYIISLRIAAAESGTWAMHGQRIGVGVAASISCSTMLQPRRSGDVDLPRPGDPPGMRKRGETDDLADYNAELGTQWVHSESTGERFLVDHAATWNETGPEGPGYYKKSGNSYEKLVPGFGED